MSLKAKNLEYGGKEPAFLRRLRGEIGGRAEPEGERSAARLSRRGPVEKSDDDDPTYVLEDSGKTLSKEEYDAFVNGDAAAEDPSKDDGKEPNEVATDVAKAEDDSKTKSSGKVTEAGRNLKKRKAAKVIKDDDEESSAAPAKNVDGDKIKDAAAPKAKKPKKKAIKLAFDD